MDRRRAQGIVSLVAHSPSWMALVFAAAVFSALPFVLPKISVTNQTLATLIEHASRLAWIFALVFLLASAVRAVDVCVRARRLSRGRQDVESLRTLSWGAFEPLVSEAFRAHGYTVMEPGGAAPGADLVLKKAGRKTVVQCWRWKQPQVTEVPVRELYQAMVSEAAHEAVFVSSGDFTPAARAFVRGKPVRLMDGHALVEMVKAVEPSSVSAVIDDVAPPLDPLSFDERVQHCPRCGGEMVIRTVGSGPNAGHAIWRCWSTPNCDGTLPIGGEV